MTIKRWEEVYKHEVKQRRFGVKLDMEDKEIEFQVTEFLALGLDRKMPCP